MKKINYIIRCVDWYLMAIVFSIAIIGLITVYPGYAAEGIDIFYKQLIFTGSSLIIIPIFASLNYSFLNGKGVSFLIYMTSIALLIGLVLFAPEINGAKSWFIIFGFSVQPIDFIKIILIIVLAKYFAVKHVNIQHFGTLLTSLMIALPIIFLTYIQPDLGSTVVLLAIWFSILLTSGIPVRYFALLVVSFLSVSVMSWFFLLKEFQKERIATFLNPYSDLMGAGYNAFQSKIAIGSGEIFGKGISEGTQSKLLFLPEYQSDFIFAAFSEEWGLIGVAFLFILFVLFFVRMFHFSLTGNTNFETLFTIGVIGVFFAHFLVHVAVNVGLAPVTGITLPLMSHGGSHLISEYIMIGMAMGMYRNRRWSGKGDLHNEISETLHSY